MAFGGPGRERNYLDIWVFNPFAPANGKPSLASVYRKHENEKMRSYNQRVTKAEHGLFFVLVFLLQVEWPKKQLSLLRGWPPYSVRSGINPIV